MKKILLIVAVCAILAVCACNNDKNNVNQSNDPAQANTTPQLDLSNGTGTTDTTSTEPRFKIPEEAELTDTQLEAAESAQAHLEVGVSRPKLIKVLVEEGFSEEDATYAVDIFGIDWMEMARGTAEFYIYYMPFSYQGMLDHLKYMEFTDEEAQYGVDSLDTDWDSMAKKYIEKYYMYHAYSDEDLIKELTNAGFTEAQAKTGLKEYKDDQAEDSSMREELGLD